MVDLGAIAAQIREDVARIDKEYKEKKEKENHDKRKKDAEGT